MDTRYGGAAPFALGIAVGSASTGLVVFVAWLAVKSSRNAAAIAATAAVISALVAVVTLIVFTGGRVSDATKTSRRGAD